MSEIYKKLLKVQEQIGRVSKDSDNPFYHSKYATIESVLKVSIPVLNSNGLFITQHVTTVGKDSNREPALKTIIFDVDTGEDMSSTMLLKIKSSDPQAQGSAVTYARRYALVSMLGLQQEDDDGNAATPAPIEQAMNKTQWATLGELLDEKGIKSRDDKITLVRALAGDKPLNTSAFARLEKEIKLAQPDTLQTILMDEQ